jgi:putative Ca2+/H+ antiporter (TMEM165/GDT1 family)
MFASLVLATRYRPAWVWVWVGVSAAFTAQMALAVTAGQLLTLLPHRIVDWVAAGLFVAGAAYLWFASFRSPKPDEADAARQGSLPPSFLRVAATSFTVIFLAEWGDITQLTAANLAARYNPALGVRRGNRRALRCRRGHRLTAVSVTPDRDCHGGQLAEPQGNAHERVDVVRQADPMVSVRDIGTRFLITDQYR